MRLNLRDKTNLKLMFALQLKSFQFPFIKAMENLCIDNSYNLRRSNWNEWFKTSNGQIHHSRVNKITQLCMVEGSRINSQLYFLGVP